MVSKLSLNFSVQEFECHCGECKLILPPCMLLVVLEDVRRHFGRPVKIMSGYRCLAHNKKVGGAKYSKHMRGTASDIIVEGISPAEVYDYLIHQYPDTFGIGRYDGFTHIDVREDRARWH